MNQVAGLAKKKINGRRRQPLVRSAKKESLFRELVVGLLSHGYQVRREKLKRGSGWRTLSGSCLLEQERLIFVDQRLSQDEQIEFLKGLVLSLNLSLPAKQKELAAGEDGKAVSA